MLILVSRNVVEYRLPGHARTFQRQRGCAVTRLRFSREPPSISATRPADCWLTWNGTGMMGIFQAKVLHL